MALDIVNAVYASELFYIIIRKSLDLHFFKDDPISTVRPRLQIEYVDVALVHANEDRLVIFWPVRDKRWHIQATDL